MAKDSVIDEKRNFEGIWIPSKLYITGKFSPRTKFFLVEVKSLSKSGYCYATDKHFADFLGISERMVQNIINELKKSNYLRTEYEYDGNTKAIKRRFLILTDKFYNEFYNEKEGTEKKFDRGTEKNCGEKYNNKNKNKKDYSAPEPHDTDFDSEIVKTASSLTDNGTIITVIDYYLKKYKRELCRPHPNVTYSALENIIYNIETVLQDVWEDVASTDGLIRMIDRHFDTNYGQKIDYKINHFGTVGVIEFQARNCGLITGMRDGYV